jgi:hypothetical protein
MPSSGFSAIEFLDSLKAGWGLQYGPTLHDVGFNDIDDAKGVSNDELEELLKGPLEKAGALPNDVLRIVASIHTAASTLPPPVTADPVGSTISIGTPTAEAVELNVNMMVDTTMSAEGNEVAQIPDTNTEEVSPPVIDASIRD